MEECLILVDNSNIFIGGQEFSARKKRLAYPQDYSWRIDFGALLREVANGHSIIKALLVGSTPPPNDSLWHEAKKSGFEVITYERSPSGEKAVDNQHLVQVQARDAMQVQPGVVVMNPGMSGRLTTRGNGTPGTMSRSRTNNVVTATGDGRVCALLPVE